VLVAKSLAKAPLDRMGAALEQILQCDESQTGMLVDLLEMEAVDDGEVLQATYTPVPMTPAPAPLPSATAGAGSATPTKKAPDAPDEPSFASLLPAFDDLD
jgi:hypothetical protein